MAENGLRDVFAAFGHDIASLYRSLHVITLEGRRFLEAVHEILADFLEMLGRILHIALHLTGSIFTDFPESLGWGLVIGHVIPRREEHLTLTEKPFLEEGTNFLQRTMNCHNIGHTSSGCQFKKR